MMATSLDEEVYVLESTVRGYHAYMNNWTPVIGQIIIIDNNTDSYSITVHNVIYQYI